MRSVEEHQRVIAGLVRPRAPARVHIGAAQGLVLADDVVATLSLPVFDNSAMDGYAVRAEDVAGADSHNPVILPVAEDIPAGRTDRLTLTPGTAHRIMTGAPVPSGATAVVPVELTDGGARTVEIRSEPKSGQHIRRAGEDVAAGTTVLRGGEVLGPAALGLLAALGVGVVAVIPRQRVLVVSTGSELVPAGTELQPGQIYESNAIMLSAAVRDAGAEVAGVATCGDDVGEFRAALDRYAGQADLVVTSGGVSAGAYEVVKDAFADGWVDGRRPSGSAGDGRRPSGSAGDGRRPSGSAGDGRRPSGSAGVEFVKVAMQPGMPQGAGTLANGCPIVTLPGNPVSVLVSFEVFLRAALRAAMGLPEPHRPRRTAVLTEAITSPAGKRQFRRGVYDSETGTVTSYGPPASHHLRWLASANCLLDIGAEVTALHAGADVAVWDLSR